MDKKLIFYLLSLFLILTISIIQTSAITGSTITPASQTQPTPNTIWYVEIYQGTIKTTILTNKYYITPSSIQIISEQNKPTDITLIETYKDLLNWFQDKKNGQIIDNQNIKELAVKNDVFEQMFTEANIPMDFETSYGSEIYSQVSNYLKSGNIFLSLPEIKSENNTGIYIHYNKGNFSFTCDNIYINKNQKVEFENYILDNSNSKEIRPVTVLEMVQEVDEKKEIDYSSTLSGVDFGLKNVNIKNKPQTIYFKNLWTFYPKIINNEITKIYLTADIQGVSVNQKIFNYFVPPYFVFELNPTSSTFSNFYFEKEESDYYARVSQGNLIIPTNGLILNGGQIRLDSQTNKITEIQLDKDDRLYYQIPSTYYVSSIVAKSPIYLTLSIDKKSQILFDDNWNFKFIGSSLPLKEDLNFKFDNFPVTIKSGNYKLSPKKPYLEMKYDKNANPKKLTLITQGVKSDVWCTKPSGVVITKPIARATLLHEDWAPSMNDAIYASLQKARTIVEQGGVPVEKSAQNSLTTQQTSKPVESAYHPLVPVMVYQLNEDEKPIGSPVRIIDNSNINNVKTQQTQTFLCDADYGDQGYKCSTPTGKEIVETPGYLTIVYANNQKYSCITDKTCGANNNRACCSGGKETRCCKIEPIKEDLCSRDPPRGFGSNYDCVSPTNALITTKNTKESKNPITYASKITGQTYSTRYLQVQERGPNPTMESYTYECWLDQICGETDNSQCCTGDASRRCCKRLLTSDWQLFEPNVNPIAPETSFVQPSDTETPLPQASGPEALIVNNVVGASLDYSKQENEAKDAVKKAGLNPGNSATFQETKNRNVFLIQSPNSYYPPMLLFYSTSGWQWALSKNPDIQSGWVSIDSSIETLEPHYNLILSALKASESAKNTPSTNQPIIKQHTPANPQSISSSTTSQSTSSFDAAPYEKQLKKAITAAGGNPERLTNPESKEDGKIINNVWIYTSATVTPTSPIMFWWSIHPENNGWNWKMGDNVDPNDGWSLVTRKEYPAAAEYSEIINYLATGSTGGTVSAGNANSQGTLAAPDQTANPAITNIPANSGLGNSRTIPSSTFYSQNIDWQKNKFIEAIETVTGKKLDDKVKNSLYNKDDAYFKYKAGDAKTDLYYKYDETQGTWLWAPPITYIYGSGKEPDSWIYIDRETTTEEDSPSPTNLKIIRYLKGYSPSQVIKQGESIIMTSINAPSVSTNPGNLLGGHLIFTRITDPNTISVYLDNEGESLAEIDIATNKITYKHLNEGTATTAGDLANKLKTFLESNNGANEKQLIGQLVQQGQLSELFWPVNPSDWTGNGDGLLRTSSGGYRNHDGQDIFVSDTAYKTGTNVYAIEKGTITEDPVTYCSCESYTTTNHECNGNAGNTITIKYTDGLSGNILYARYLHLKEGSIKVKKGDSVDKGQSIAQVGKTGNSCDTSTSPHLHLEINLNDNGKNSQNLNPLFLPSGYEQFLTQYKIKNNHH